jgi:Domain of unknown function (DUF1992)
VSRKPPGASWESWVERQIREGVEQGAFAGLPGQGRPLVAIDDPHDDDWWLKEKLRREEIEFLPPTLRVRRELEDARAAIARATDEESVRMIVDEINQQIRDVNRLGAAGPPSTVMVLDIDDVLARWRAAR